MQHRRRLLGTVTWLASPDRSVDSARTWSQYPKQTGAEFMQPKSECVIDTDFVVRLLTAGVCKSA
jgi:hypothetical protein